MDKKEYLNEEWYQKVKGKVKKVALGIFLIGLIIGLIMIIFGITSLLKSDNKSGGQESKVKTEEIAGLKDELAELKALQNEEFETNGFSAKYYKYDNKIESKENEINNLEYSFPSLIKKGFGGILIIIGGNIIFWATIISVSVYFIAIRREVAAFKMQQVMPLAQEGIEKMAPTVGSAAGTIAHDIASGIKSGITENNNTEEK